MFKLYNKYKKEIVYQTLENILNLIFKVITKHRKINLQNETVF